MDDQEYTFTLPGGQQVRVEAADNGLKVTAISSGDRLLITPAANNAVTIRTENRNDKESQP